MKRKVLKSYKLAIVLVLLFWIGIYNEIIPLGSEILRFNYQIGPDNEYKNHLENFLKSNADGPGVREGLGNRLNSVLDELREDNVPDKELNKGDKDKGYDKINDSNDIGNKKDDKVSKDGKKPGQGEKEMYNLDKSKEQEKVDKDADSRTPEEIEQRLGIVKSFYSKVFDYMITFSPTGKSERKYNSKCNLTGDIGDRADYYSQWYKLSKKRLASCLEIDSASLAMLKSTHLEFVERIGELVMPQSVYRGKGIVTVGGGRFSVLSFSIISTLRKLGTTLPVEVFIPPQDENEMELEYCNKLLPTLNAKCIFISDILPKETIEKTEFKGYQFKSIAMIASSFRDLLLLDADNYPIKNLNNIFEQEPYKDTGLVLWPDFWRRTTSPLYYDIAGIPIDDTKRVRNSIDSLTPPEVYTKNMKDLSNVPLHDLKGTIPDVSTESGQLLINKSKHLPTLLLSLYYNFNGPSWYYPIFSQRASGEGDKETFIASALFYDLPYYQVKTKTGVDGYHQKNNKGFRGVAMLQHDFAQDYMRYKKAKEDIAFKYKDKSKRTYDRRYSLEDFYKTHVIGVEDRENGVGEVDVMFVHSNLPKFDPVTSWKENDLIEDGQHFRSFTKLEKLNNYDIELENFKLFHEYLCLKQKDFKFKYIEDALGGNEEFRESMCKYIKDRLTYLNSSHHKAIAKPI